MEGLEPAEKMGMIKIHAVLGIVIFILTIIRSWLFFKASRPIDLQTGSKFNDKLAIGIHNAFYFLLFGIAISRIATMVFGGYREAISNENSELIINQNEILPLKGHGIMALILSCFLLCMLLVLLNTILL